jgi:hypothetical protein
MVDGRSACRFGGDVVLEVFAVTALDVALRSGPSTPARIDV